jgi:hypothetical protein
MESGCKQLLERAKSHALGEKWVLTFGLKKTKMVLLFIPTANPQTPTDCVRTILEDREVFP